MITTKNISVMSNDTHFLMRLLTFKSLDKVRQAFVDEGFDISLEYVERIRKIVSDLENNEEQLTEDDMKVILEAGKNINTREFFDEALYNMYYNCRNKYPSDFFLNKSYYDGDTIAKGLFTIACCIFRLKKEYLKNRDLWRH